MRTYDRARRDGVISPLGPRTKTAAEGLTNDIRNGLPVYVIDNIAEYAYADDREMSWEMYPSVAPPRPYFWMEWHSPSGNERRAVIGGDMAHLRGQLPDSAEDAVDNCIADARKNGYEGEIGWVLGFTVLIQSPRKRIFGPVGWIMFALDERGRPLGNRFILHPALPCTGGDPNNEADREAEGLQLLTMAMIPLQALAFLHCKNVKVEQVTQPPKLSKVYQRKTGKPLVTYQQIRLEVPRRGGSGGGKGVGGDQKLRIIDGHFAYYGDNHHSGCPPDHEPHGLLFGKLDGVYWVESHARGNRELGEVHTDRELIVP